MRRYVMRLAVLACVALGPGLARGDDQVIAQQIVQKLQQEKRSGSLKGFSIDLQVEEGVVWLSGKVSNHDQQAKALDIARRVSGVKQVVNDLEVLAAEPATGKPEQKPADKVAGETKPGMFASMSQAFSKGGVQKAGAAADETLVRPASTGSEDRPMTSVLNKQGVVGTGVQPQQTINAGIQQYVATPATPILPSQGQPGVGLQTYAPPPGAGVQPIYNPQGVSAAASQRYSPAAPMRHQYANRAPVAFAPSMAVSHQGAAGGEFSGGPVPMHMPGSGAGIAPARYDHPNMPGYAWPSYASHPNYAAVTYPRQYSPTAWPYIGPFYPYPQVPLGWRKVTLEWDDGWWMLDFKDRRH